MKIKHPAVKSDVFQLKSTVEFDLELADGVVPARLELFQNTEHKDRWRARLWERESCRLETTFAPAPSPRGKRSPQRFTCDEEILVERTWELSESLEEFKAASARGAFRVVLNQLYEHLQRTRKP
jgi:hypothetical protein